ncbi:hypothetical protein Hanom_Chr10g00911871 [Helianthus anomalus]
MKNCGGSGFGSGHVSVQTCLGSGFGCGCQWSSHGSGSHSTGRVFGSSQLG